MKYLLSWLLLAPVFAFAEDTPPIDLGAQVPVAPTPAPNLSPASPNRYMVGLQSVDFNYQEPDLMSDRGRLNGISVNYLRTFDVERYFKFTADYVQGETFYNGALQTNNGITTPYTSTEKFRLINMEFILGRQRVDSIWGYTVGAGYRNTFDSKTNQYDYRRDINYYYVLLGLSPVIYNKHNMKSILNLEYSYLIGGGAKTYLSDVSSAYKDVNFEFQLGAAIKVGVETIITAFTDHQFMVDFSYKYWTLTDSKIEYIGNGSYGMEPRNNTGLMSITAGYVF